MGDEEWVLCVCVCGGGMREGRKSNGDTIVACVTYT